MSALLVIFVPFLSVCIGILDLYQIFVILYVIVSWLEKLNVLNRYNQFIYGIHTFLFRIVEPALVPLRRILPDMENIDLAPLVLIFILYFFKGVLGKILLKFPI